MYNEKRAGGFSQRDGTVQFYTRLNALLRHDMVVADVGAGRGEWLEDPVSYRRDLRLLRGKVSKVIGVDVDPVVHSNPGCDETLLMTSPIDIPLADSSVDVVLCDHTLEHISEPDRFTSEVHRVLSPGGWFAARTPNRWGYIGLATNLVPNRYHASVLHHAQPDRQERDVFPTVYGLNTRRAIRQFFPVDRWEVSMYPYNPDPAYFGRSERVKSLADAFLSRAPGGLSATWSIFCQRRG